MTIVGGDDLDELVLEDNYLAISDDELDGLVDEVEDSPSQEDQVAGLSTGNDDARRAKKRKQREKNKERKVKVSIPFQVDKLVLNAKITSDRSSLILQSQTNLSQSLSGHLSSWPII